MKPLEHVSLYEINVRQVLGELARSGGGGSLNDLPNSYWDRIASLGFSWVWLMGVWQTGPFGREVSRSRTDWREGFRKDLPDFTDADVVGSPYSIVRYQAHSDFGGDEALAQVREKLAQRGVRLMLDFVPNHTAIDHDWVYAHPNWYIAGDESLLASQPGNYFRAKTHKGESILAHGRDPYFPGWPDVAQLNYRHGGLRRAMIEQMLQVGERCDGVRCDMAMLLLPDVIQKTWGGRSKPSDGTPAIDLSFWLEAVPAVRRKHPDFFFLAEVYWDLEWALQQQGFDGTYDKRLYDRLRGCEARAVHDHLLATDEFQRRSARFLENHDEPRAATAFVDDVHRAAAMIAFGAPGVAFFHEGQFEGRKARANLHLGRRATEAPDPGLVDFYERLLAGLRRSEIRQGRWRLLACRSAWDGNPTHEQFVAYAWVDGENVLLGAVNYGPVQGQCYVELSLGFLRGRGWRLFDLMGSAQYDRSGDELVDRGLFLDMPAWGRHLFELVGI